MLKIFDEKINYFLFVVILPFLLLFMSYYGYESSYTLYKHSEKPPEYLFTSVYAYRVVPNLLSVYMTHFMDFLLESPLYAVKEFILKNGSPFYHGLFMMNSIFFIYCSVILNCFLKLKNSPFFLNRQGRRLVHLLAIFFIVISQYAPTNCDLLALSCYLTGILFTIKYYEGKNIGYYYALITLIILSTFVRETACLNLAFFASLFFSFNNLKKGNLKDLYLLIPLVLAFIIPYLGLRKIIVLQETTFVEGFYIAKNFTSPFNLSGLLFAFVAMYFVYDQMAHSVNKFLFKKYIFFSSPYLAMITLVGLYWEVRLFIPLLLTGIIILGYRFKNSLY